MAFGKEAAFLWGPFERVLLHFGVLLDWLQTDRYAPVIQPKQETLARTGFADVSNGRITMRPYRVPLI